MKTPPAQYETVPGVFGTIGGSLPEKGSTHTVWDAPFLP